MPHPFRYLILSPLLFCTAILPALGNDVRTPLVTPGYAAPPSASESAALLLQGHALRARAQHREALRVYDTLLSRHPNAAEKNKALFGKAASLMALKRFDEAGQILRASLARLSAPQRIESQALVYIKMADQLREPEDKSQPPDQRKAISLYSAALDLGTLPHELEHRIRISRAQSLIQLAGRQELNQAGEDLEALLKKTPAQSLRLLTELHYQLGRVYRRLSRTDAAEHYLTLASRSTNQGEIPLLAASELLEVLGFPSAKRPELKRGRLVVRDVTTRFAKNKRSEGLLFRLALAELYLMEYETGLASLKNYLTKWPDGEHAAEAYFRSAETLFGLKRHAAAVQDLRSLLARFPGSEFWQRAQRLLVTVEFGEADQAMRGEEYARAGSLWSRFISRYPLDPRTPTAALFLGQSLEKRKDWQAAVACWQDVWRRWPASTQGHEACLRAARLLADKLDKPEEALKLLKKLTDTKYRQEAGEAIRELENESLALSTRGVFPAGRVPRVELKVRNIPKLRLRIYHLDSEAYFRSKAGFTGMEKLDVDLISPDKDFWITVPAYKKYKLQELSLPVAVTGPGTWVVQCTSDTLQASTLLVKSDLGLVVRAAPGQVVVQTTDLKTGAPAAGAEVLLSNGVGVFASGKTDADGILSYNATNEQAAATLSVYARLGKNVAAVSPGWFDRYRPAETRLVTHLAADRQVWRPGDKVHFRLTLRLKDATGGLRPPRESFFVSARSPSGIEVFSQNLSPDELGTISGEFSIDPAEAPGILSLSLINSKRTLSATHQLRIEHYIPRETNITFSQTPRIPLLGDRIDLTATCSYLWGEAAAGRQLLWRINQEDWNTAVTDPSGQVKLQIDSAKRISGRALTLSLKPSWEDRIYTHEISFAKQDVSLSLKPRRTIWLESEKPVLELALTPLPGLSARRSVVISTSLLTNGRTLPIAQTTLSLTGKRTLSLPALRPGKYRITALTHTSTGEEVRAWSELEISGAKDPKRIHLLQDGTEVTSGAVVRLRIHSRLAKAQEGLLLFERDRIVRQERIRIPVGESTFSFIPGKELAPQFRLVLLVATTNGFYSTQADFTLKHALQLEAVPTSRPVPGKEVTLRFSSKTPQGKGTAADLFVFVLDDAIWSAVNASGKDITETFYPRLPLVASQAASFTPFSYSATTTARDPEIVKLEQARGRGRRPQGSLEPELALREKRTSEDAPLLEQQNLSAAIPAWAELAWHTVHLKTDRSGNAQARFILPERPASWRIVAVAASTDSLFGNVETVMQAVSPTQAKIHAPASLTLGDAIQLPLIISTRLERKQQGQLQWRLETESGSELASGRLPWSVNPSSSSEVAIPIRPSKTGSCILRVTDPAFRAAVPILVLPAGDKRVSGTSALVRTSWEKRLPHTQGAVQRNLRIKIEHPEAILLEGIPDFIGKNQLSGIIAGLVRDTAALEYLVAIRKSEAIRHNSLRSAIKSRLEHLAILALTEWQSTPPPDSETAWLGFALQRCRSVGIEVEAALANWTRERLEQIFSASDNNEFKALALFAMAGGKDSPFAWLNRLYRERNRLAPRETALLALALEAAGRRAMSSELVRLLTRLFVRKDGQAYIPTPPARHCHWMAGTSGTTALAALALSLMPSDRERTTIITEALAWLDEHRPGFGWHTPAENGIIPLIHARQLIAQSVSASWIAQISINGKPLGQVSSARPALLQLSGDELAGAASRIQLRLEGHGPCRVQCELVEIMPPTAPLQNDFSSSFEVSLKHPPYTLEGKALPRGMSILAEQAANPTNELTRISKGSPFSAEIRLGLGNVRPDDVCVVELPFPAGCRPTGLIDGRGVIQRELLPGRIRYLIKAPPALGTVRIQEGLVAFAEGRSWLGSASCFPLSSPWQRTTTQRKPFVIGSPRTDNFAGYHFSADELYRIGEWYFRQAEYDKAKALLDECLSRWQLKPEPAKAIALMLLQIAVQKNAAREIIHHFESLKEKHQDLSIPLEQADAVALAYARIGEHERACQVLEGIIEARFLQDSALSAAWLSANKVRQASATLRNLWLEYPDGNEEITSVSSFAQQLFQMSNELSADELAKRGVQKDWLKDEALALFDTVLAAAPTSALAPEIAFSSVSLLFEREHWREAEQRARVASETYTNSSFADSFKYLLASTLYFSGQFAQASAQCEALSQKLFKQEDGTQRPSRYRDYALHMLGKIRHSEQRQAEAIRLYEKVKSRFSDAARAIEQLKQRTLSFPEITIVPLEDETSLTITAHNVSSAQLTLYKVDFFMLCLKQKDLRNVTGINLAGIRPSVRTNIRLPKSGQIMSETSRITIPVRDKGAWLVVLKAEGVEQSGIIIRSDLVLDVLTTEDGSVRASLHEHKKSRPLAGAQIRFIPSNGQRSTTATSDPRGIAEAQASQGEMIVAALHDGQYAFQRVQGQRPLQRNNIDDYGSDYKDKSMEELRQYRKSIQDTNKERWEKNQKFEKRQLELKNLKF